MNFDLTDDQKMLAETVASFAARTSPLSRFRASREDPAAGITQWKQMAELGWLALPFPETVGGYAGSFVDLAIIVENLATTLVPEPYLASVVLGGSAVLHSGSAEQHERFLAPMIAGDCTLALAYAERAGRYDPTFAQTRAEKTGSGYRLDGEKVFVLDGLQASQLVVSAQTPDGLGLFVVNATAPGLERTLLRTLDGRFAAHVRLNGVKVDGDHMLGAAGAEAEATLERVIDLGAAAACAEGVGVGAATLKMTVEYLGTREQFGVKIGTFQALQHRAADMFVQLELCRSMGILAAIQAEDERPEVRRRAISAAKAQLSVGGRFIVQEAVQLHGGVGCTDEHDVGLYFKRMHALCALFGDEAHHVRRFASLPGFDSAARTSV